MKVLLIGINYSPDFMGVAKYNTELCEALALRGHEVRVITAPPYYPDWKVPGPYRGLRYRSETINGVEVSRSPIYVPKVPSGIRRLLHHASFSLSSALLTFWRALTWRPDVILSIAPSLMSAAVAAFMARRSGAVCWLHIQDLEVDAAFDLNLLRGQRLRKVMLMIERKILRAFDKVSTISPQMRERLQDKGLDANNIREVRNWIDLRGIIGGNNRTNLRNEFGFGASDIVGLYSGTMSNKQGIEVIVESARELEKTHSNIKFVLSGNGPHRQRLMDLASGLANVSFSDFQPPERFGELLRTADFHLIPQKAQAADLVLPSKLGGIFASARPAIVMAQPNTGLAQEVEGAGLVISPGDASVLTKAVLLLAGDSDLRASLGANGRRRAIERWDKEAIINLLTAELTVLDQQRRPGLRPEKTYSV